VFGELREKGLAYGIYGGQYDTKDNTIATISGQVQADNFIELLDILKREINDVADNAITDTELSDLKRRTYGEIQRHHQTVSQISGWYRYVYTMRDEIVDYKDINKRLEAVTVQSVKQAANDLLDSGIKGMGLMFSPDQKPNIGLVKSNFLAR
jgi:predicted Zn-dependent peptidase